MDVSYVNPFITATVNSFKTLMGLELTRGKIAIKTPATPGYDYSASIGISGEAKGFISVCYPGTLAEKLVSMMLGQEVKKGSQDLVDGIGEISNIIAGNAKQYLTQYKVSISLPNVVAGTNHDVNGRSDVPVIMVPFTCPHGELTLEVSLKTP